MKKVYFVRHGESEGNIGTVRHAGGSPLTTRGQTQATTVAARIQKLPIDYIFSSTITRARETAEIIGKHHDLSITYNEVFVERRRPSIQYGRPKDDVEALQAAYEIDTHFAEPHYRHSDEENFDDLKARAADILHTLEAAPGSHILVVTHGFIMRIVFAYMLFDESLTGPVCADVIRTCHMQNTGITVFGYDATKEKPWWLWAWNDHAHLADLPE